MNSMFDGVFSPDDKPPDDMFSSVLSPAAQQSDARLRTREMDPAAAAKAGITARDLNVSPGAVAQDPDHFNKIHETAQASAIVQASQYLRDYVNSNPLSASISADDWPTLHEFVKSAEKFSPTEFGAGLGKAAKMMAGPAGGEVAGAGVRTFFKTFWDHKLGEWRHRDPEYQKWDRFGGWALIGLPLETVGAAIDSGLKAIEASAGEFGKQMGWDDQTVEQFKRTVGGIAEYKVIEPGHKLHITDQEAVRLQVDQFKKVIQPYLEKGEPIPPGVHPITDKIAVEQAKLDADNLAQALKDAAKSETLKLDPDHFADNLAHQVVKDADVGITAESLRKTFGENLPEWIEGIEDRIIAAERSNGDIQVPLKDVLAHPDDMGDLVESTRVRPNAMTAEEAKLHSEQEAARKELPEHLSSGDATVDMMRKEAGLEPTFDDQRLMKLKLERSEGPAVEAEPVEGAPLHNFHLTDQTGQAVGDLSISEMAGGKSLYVNWIGAGPEGLNVPGSLGPRVVRDLLAQIKQEFPNAEEIGGFRVSGVREKVGRPGEMKIRLDMATNAEIEKFIGAFRLGQLPLPPGAILTPTKHLAGGIAYESLAKFRVSSAIDALPSQTLTEVSSVLRSLFGEKIKELAGDVMVHVISTGDFDKIHRGGAQAFYDAINHRIIVRDTAAAFSPEAYAHIVLHESAHAATYRALLSDKELYNRIDHLRDYLSIIVSDLAAKGDRRAAEVMHYGLTNPGELLAEAWSNPNFQTYLAGIQLRPEVASRLGLPTNTKTLWDAVKEIIHQIIEKVTGKKVDATALDAILNFGKDFERLHAERSAELRQRGGPTWEKLFGVAADPALARPEIKREPGEKPFAPAPVGFTQRMHDAYLKAIDRLTEGDNAALRAAYMEDARKKETQIWKKEKAQVREDVAAQLNNHPVFRLDEMLRGGAKILTEGLTESQIAALPKKNVTAFRKKGGVSIDNLAKVLDVSSGNKLMTDYMAMLDERNASRTQYKEYLNRKIDAETERQMELRHGDLQERITERALDRIFSEEQQRVLSEETLRYAMRAGKTPIPREQIMAEIQQELGSEFIRNIKSKDFMRNGAREARSAEEAAIKGDPAKAFQHAQNREYAYYKAQLAVQHERAKAKLDRKLAMLKERELPKTHSQEFLNATHTIMMKLNLPVDRTPADLLKEMQGIGQKGLADWVADKERDLAIEGIELNIPDFLLDRDFKKNYNDLNLWEFNGVNQAITLLDHLGREEKKAKFEGLKVALDAHIDRMVEQLSGKFPVLTAAMTKGRTHGLNELYKTALAASTGMETVFFRFDNRDFNGIFTKTFVYPGAEAANYLARLEREFGAEYSKLGKIPNAKQLLDPPLREADGRPLKNFTRSNLATIISNMGNEYNWRVLTEGWRVDPQVLWDWVMENSTKEDFDRAHALSKIFAKAKGMSDTVYRNLYEIAPENIPVRPFTAHGKEYPGWYHPIIRDPLRSKVDLLKTADPLETGPTTYWPSPSNSYVKRRTGAIDVLDLTYDFIPLEINKILNDVAMRDFIYNSAKIIRNNKFRTAIKNYYGQEYVEEMDRWLARAAGQNSFNSKALSVATRFSNALRQNVVTTHIAFGLGTVQKHGGTAFFMSAKELGPNSLAGIPKMAKLTADIGANWLYHATTDLFGKDPYLGDTLSRFINENSEEIQRRERHFLDTVTDYHRKFEEKSTLRNAVAYWGAKAVAFSDKVSSKPLWLGKYRQILQETGDHGYAVSVANFAVRRAHGSTAVTSLPRIATGGGILEPWMTTLYGFMGANMQRRIEIAHDINDAYKLGRAGELKAAAKALPQIIDSVMANVLWVGIIEELVTHQFTDDHRSGLERTASFFFHTLTQTIIGLRDFSYAITHGKDPAMGLTSAPLSEIHNLIRDFGKPGGPMSRQNAGKFAEDTITVMGDLTGVGPKPVARAVHYGIDVLNRQQRPHGGGDIYRGIFSGKQEPRVVR